MRICTLIVRLLGIIIMLYSVHLLIELKLVDQQIAQIEEIGVHMPMAIKFTAAVRQKTDRFLWYGIFGIVLGGVMAISAPKLAWLLTYDAEETDGPDSEDEE